MLDTVIIGAGPAGLSAAVYAKRAGLKALLVEESPIMGGQVLSTYEVDNYLGLPGISGIDLGEKFALHMGQSGIDNLEASVQRIVPTQDGYQLITDVGEYDTKTIIVATGARHAHLNVPGEEELSGMGVSYCATCDGAFFKDRDVCVVGGSDVAVEDAIYLSRTCRHVYLVHRRNSLRAADSLVKTLEKCENVSIVWDSEVQSIEGEDSVDSVTLVNNKDNTESKLFVEGVFVAVGINPTNELLEGLVEIDEGGYVTAGEDCRTSRRGIYVAGDLRRKPLRQIITAVADGANAIASVQSDL